MGTRSIFLILHGMWRWEIWGNGAIHTANRCYFNEYMTWILYPQIRASLELQNVPKLTESQASLFDLRRKILLVQIEVRLSYNVLCQLYEKFEICWDWKNAVSEHTNIWTVSKVKKHLDLAGFLIFHAAFDLIAGATPKQPRKPKHEENKICFSTNCLAINFSSNLFKGTYSGSGKKKTDYQKLKRKRKLGEHVQNLRIFLKNVLQKEKKNLKLCVLPMI